MEKDAATHKRPKNSHKNKPILEKPKRELVFLRIVQFLPLFTRFILTQVLGKTLNT